MYQCACGSILRQPSKSAIAEHDASIKHRLLSQPGDKDELRQELRQIYGQKIAIHIDFDKK